jgi:hypothetical protein
MDLIRNFQKAIEEALQMEGNTLADGGAMSFEDYKARVGMRRGLKRALTILDDVMADAKARDEDF